MTTTEDTRREPDVFDKVRQIDLLPRFPQPIATAQTGRTEGLGAQTYLGAPGTGAAPSNLSGVTGAQAVGSDAYELNFENTPVSGVVKVVLGDILGLGYLIDPRVQGTVTLASGRPVPKGDLLFVLESALKLSGSALVRDRRGYIVTPAADAMGTGGIDAAGRGEPGFGITAVPLQHVSATTLLKLLDSFALKPGTVRAEPQRNLALVQGNGNDRRTAAETILSFDADWMRGQSVGIFPLRNSAPELIMSELERIMDSGEGGLSQTLVKLQPIARQNAVMVISSKPNLLRTAGMWITRLDKADTATGVKVYHVRYGDARQIAVLLNDIFGAGRQGGSAVDGATNQIAPGAGVITASSDQGTTQGGLRIGGARQLPGGSSDSRLSTGTPGGAAGGTSIAGGSAVNDSLSSRFGQFGRGGSGSGATSFGSPAGGGGQPILPGVRITADPVNNTLLIYANQENYRVIEQTLRQLDRPQLQVSIDATIAEITLNENLNYGVQFFLNSSDVGARPD